MRISKSILSPSHGRRHEPPLTLPTSLSRRLKANGSIKGGQSPATFPPTTTTGKKRGSGFDNPEPSSPKVTCIGQVKMKTKKKVSRQTRSLSNTGGERGLLLVQNQKSNCNSSVHFQQPQDRNQRWVHLPLTIYEGLRDFSCLFPCRRSSSCFSTNDKEIETKPAKYGSRDVVARWLVSLQDVESEKMETSSRMRSSRRHVFEGVELKEGTVVEEEEEEKGRVSICIPPKNALLLMRCRSDPMKMADITNRFLQSPTRKETDEQVEDREEVVDAQNIECRLLEETVDLVENEENPEAVEVVMEMDEKETEQEDEEESEIKALAAAEVNSTEQVAESIVDQTAGNIQYNHVPESEKEEDSNIHSYSSFSENSNAECTETLEEDEKFKSTIEKIIEDTLLWKDIDEEEEANAAISVPKIEYPKESRKQQNESILPDCLLLMMCEPKLSMEVSKETWVYSSSTTEEQNKSTQYLQLQQPPRSSCSLPAMSSMATMIEHKLLNTLAYEPPLVLTRCKSEPMRIAAAKLEPGTCFWNNRKIEPHRRAGVGF